MATMDEIKARVADATKAAESKVGIADIDLEIDRDEDGDRFLRVIIKIRNRDRATDDDYQKWLEAIELAVSDIDDLYPSVRFSDAA